MKVSIQEDMWEVISKLPEDQGEKLSKALIAYGFTGQEPEPCSETWYYIFIAFRGRIELSAKQSAAGRDYAAKRWDAGDEEPDMTADTSDGSAMGTHDGSASSTHDAENEKEKEKEKSKDTAHDEVQIATFKVVAHINAACGTSFRTSSSATKRLVSGRLRDGYTVEDMVDVIDVKTGQWLHDRRMRKYLRPETLLAPTKFEGYLQEARATRARAGNMAEYDQVAEVIGG